MGRVGRVIALLRYPLKSARAERVGSVSVEAGGLFGDRGWACLEEADGTVGSVKHPRRWGRLLQVGATAGPASDGEEPPVTVHVEGESWPAGGEGADAALSALLGRPVRLTRTVPEGARLHRLLPEYAGLVPDWLSGSAGEEMVTAVGGAKPGGRFVDYGAVHLVTTGALDGLTRLLGRTGVPAVRFRPNLVIDAPADPAPGTELRLGDAVLRVTLPTPRCIVPGLDPSASTDRGLLAALARHYRRELPGLGHAACFGTYAEVVRPGTLRVGQPVR